MRSRALRWTVRGCLAVAALYLVLLVPEGDPVVTQAADRRPFRWNRDEYWLALESRFARARVDGCAAVAPRVAEHLAALEPLARRLEGEPLAPDDAALEGLETGVFELAPLLAACPERV